MPARPCLTVENLGIAYPGAGGRVVQAVADASLTLAPGEIVGVAGESGSGKSTLCTALMRALPKAARVSGRILLGERSLYELTPAEMRAVRGREITMILQNPMTSLDPLFTIGDQLVEVLRRQRSGNRRELKAAAIALLGRVYLTAPALRMTQYPHQLSGGMKQRVLIAMATACSPRILLADEPTTALDATVQEEILLLFEEIRDRDGTAILMVTHDLSAIRRVCDRTIVMYAGRIVEEGPTDRVFEAPCHPYTRALLASMPHLVDDEVVLDAIPGQVPSLAELGPGCAFVDRCPRAFEPCGQSRPVEARIAPDHRVFCWRYGHAP